MHVASVTLDEVLRAAARRSAALVPETAGYLALAIGDASARLPYRLDDELVTLTTEGTVRVARGRVQVGPDEGARVLRDLLRRLLSVSAGSMPGLAHAAVARDERSGPDAVIAEVEAALIPVNRAAARRSLARLARDTARARDAGRLAPSAPAPRAPVRVERPHPPEEVAVGPTYAVTTPTPAGVSLAAIAVDGPPVALEGLDEPPTPFQAALACPRPMPVEVPEELTHRLDLPVRAVATSLAAAVVAAAEAAADEAAVADDDADEVELQVLAALVDRTEPTGMPSEVTTIDAEVVELRLDDVEDDPTDPEDDPALHLLELRDPPGVDSLDGGSVTDARPVEAAPAVAEHAPAVVEVAPAVVEAAPAVEVAPAVVDAPPAVVEAAPIVVEVAPAVVEAAPIVVEVAPAVVEAAPIVVEVAPAVVEAAPRDVDDAARSLEEALRAGRLTVPARAPMPQPPTARARPWQAELAPAAQSDVDALLARFGPSEPTVDARAMRRDLKNLVGIDATQLPPRVASR